MKDYKFYVANYEAENKSNAKTYTRQLNKIDKDLKQVKEDLQNALLKYNRNKLSEEEYIFLRNYTLEEENRLKAKKIALNKELEIDEVASKRKAIPILENCLNEYDNLSVPDKHKLLSAIIEKIEYSKTEGGRWKEELRDNFELTLYLKL